MLFPGLGLDDIFTVNDSGVVAELPDGIPGSTLGLVSSGHSISTSYSYQPFGQKTTNGNRTNNPTTFQRGVLGGGLYYFRNRYYNPALQRWMSRDPLGIGGGDANLYAYAGNDPINFADPLGLQQSGQAAWGAKLEGAGTGDMIAGSGPGDGTGPGPGDPNLSSSSGFAAAFDTVLLGWAAYVIDSGLSGPIVPGGTIGYVNGGISGLPNLSGLGGVGKVIPIQAVPKAVPNPAPTPANPLHVNTQKFLLCSAFVTALVPAPVVGCGAGIFGCLNKNPAGCLQAAGTCPAATVNYLLCFGASLEGKKP